MATKVLLVGRHAGVIPEVEVLEQKNVMFPTTAAGTAKVLGELIAEALQMGAEAVLFQMCPAQLAVALAARYGYYGTPDPVGFVISVPGDRPAAKVVRIKDSPGLVGTVKEINPNARVEIAGNELIITIDPPMVFKFSHIEWLIAPE